MCLLVRSYLYMYGSQLLVEERVKNERLEQVLLRKDRIISELQTQINALTKVSASPAWPYGQKSLLLALPGFIIAASQ